MVDQVKYILPESEMPTSWINILPLLKNLDPPLHPGTGKPASPEDFAPIFPMELIKQEASLEPVIPIPEELLKILRMWRPTPLIRARRLEKAGGYASQDLL